MWTPYPTPDVKSLASLRSRALYIVGAGAQTPLGRYVLAAAAAARCGMSAYAEHPFMIDKDGEPMIVGRARWLEDSFSLEQRVGMLATDAVMECLRPIIKELPALRRQLRTHFALSAESFPQLPQRQRFLDGFAAGAALNSSGPIEVVAEGHAGGLLALSNACRELQSGEAQFCLVGGADSYMDPMRLQDIDLAGRLHSIKQRWGFTPGEGAAFCLITTGDSARRLHLMPLAEVLAVATAQEAKLMGTEAVCLGDGLTAAFRGVLDPKHRVSHCYCDLNGETYRADEYGFAICRTSDYFDDAARFTAAAESWGDVGAASGSLALTLALAAWARGYARGPVNLVWASSAHAPLRGAALLRQWDATAR